MENNRNTNYALLAVVFVVGVGAGLIIYMLAAQSLSLGQYGMVGAKRDTMEDGASRQGRDVSRLLSYEQAKTQFDGRRIQFDNCASVPSQMTVKNGTQIMLDNRSADPHEIRVDGVLHRLWGYEFKLITLTNSNLPHTASFDCEAAGTVLYNTAEVLIQQ